MPTFVLKLEPGKDRYVLWSTVVDHWTAEGTRAEILAWLEQHEPRGYTADPGHSPKDRLRRADETGTSALWPSPAARFGGWNDEELIVEQRGLLARSDIGEFVDRSSGDDPESACALLTPFEDEVSDG